MLICALAIIQQHNLYIRYSYNCEHWIDNVYYLKDLFESILDYRKTVLLIYLIEGDKDLLREIGFSARDINCLNLEFKNILIEQHEEYLDYITSEEE